MLLMDLYVVNESDVESSRLYPEALAALFQFARKLLLVIDEADAATGVDGTGKIWELFRYGYPEFTPEVKVQTLVKFHG